MKVSTKLLFIIAILFSCYSGYTQDLDQDNVLNNVDLDLDNDGITNADEGYSVDCITVAPPEKFRLGYINDNRDLDFDNGYTYNGNFMDDGPTDKLLNPANFSFAGGIVNTDIELISINNNPITLSNLNSLNLDMIFIGGVDTVGCAYTGDSYLSVSETNAIKSWSTADSQNLVVVTNSAVLRWGFSANAYDSWQGQNNTITAFGANETLFNGPFGTITNFDSGGCYRASLGNLDADDVVLATYDYDGNPSIVLDGATGDLIVSEVDVFTELVVSPGPNINSSNDIFYGNIIAYAVELVLCTENEIDTDNDGLGNHIDIDSDNDGIPDNVEAQTTIGYTIPSGSVNSSNGLNNAYGSGLTAVDTDNDGTPDYMDDDSDNDGTPDIQENGHGNTLSNNDTDQDGLDNNFDSNNGSFDTNDEISTGSTAQLVSTFGDVDGDVLSGGDLDYRDLFDGNPPFSASIDFDGVNDYADSDAILGDLNQTTVMGWIKLDPTFNSDGRLFGQDNFVLEIDGASRLLTTTINGNSSTSADALPLDQWVHIAVIYSSSPIANGVNARRVRIYFNGSETSNNNGGGLNVALDASSTPFTIGKSATSNSQYFKGAIDEIRVFNTVLTESQIQRMIYQEIQQNGVNVAGAIVPKDLLDTDTNATIPWNTLEAYWPMTNIKTGKTLDASSSGKNLTLYNITTVQPQTAPMPYETTQDGDWSDMSTWTDGDVWDVGDADQVKDWSIIRINSNITVSESVSTNGLVIASDKTLTVVNGNVIVNNWYLELNGTLDLAGDSQLIQTETSDLITSADGKILRRQEGNADVYWYNYWTSPVGSLGATTLADNNGTSNNTNNTSFNLSMLKDGTGTDMQFTSASHEVGKISDNWLYSFQNGQTYWDWVALSSASTIAPGIGYTQKGTGNAGTEQQYIFEGKPNNGTILVAANDVDGDSGNESQQDVTLTTTLIGNPYPSALDADEFIRDNTDFDNGGANPIIQGTILLWEQWAGSSHYLAEYEGGYGYINLTETARAYQHPDIPIAGQTQAQGIKTPTKFIPVGQGFFVEVVQDGDIEFNNSQRVFKDENSGESVFFRGAESQENNADEEDTETNPMQTIKLEFSASNGATRRFVLGFSEDTTDDFDYGYDGGLITQIPEEDMTTILEGKLFVIQAYSPITAEKEIDLAFSASGNYTYSLDIAEMKNIDENQDVFIKDGRQNIYWNLTQDGAYHFSSEAGQFNDRFDIVFKNDQTLNNDNFEIDHILVYNNNPEHKLYVKGLVKDAKSLTLTNILGQTVKYFNEISANKLENGIYIGDLSSGVYMLNLTTSDNLKIDKKIILE